jgi:hypothetical protein
MKISSCCYYRWKKQPLSKRAKESINLKVEINRVFEASHRIYGSPRVHQELKSEGFLFQEPRRNDEQVNSKKAELIEQMANINRRITEPLLFHCFACSSKALGSNRGIQYACKEFTNYLKANPLVKQSMSRKGNC